MTNGITFCGTDVITGEARLEVLDGIIITATGDEIEELMDHIDYIEREHLEDKVAAICQARGVYDAETFMYACRSVHQHEFYPEIMSDEDLGWAMIDEGLVDIAPELWSYFDAEAYGRDVRLDSNGCHTDWGYLVW